MFDPQDDDLHVIDLERAPGLGIRRSMRAQNVPPPVQERLGARKRIAYFFEPAPPEGAA